MDTAQWPQEIVVKPLEEIVTNTCPTPQESQPQPPPSAGAAGGAERKTRPEKDQAINCPRCNSVNTKFCYYNNYSLTQPRFFCKGCRRYWTEGGSLRNIPVGGGSRKNKRSHSSSISSSSDISKNPSDSTQPATKKHHTDQHPHHHLMSISQQGLNGQNPKILETTQQDLNLGFPPHGLIRTNFTDLIHNIGNNNNNNNNTSTNNPFLGSSCSATSALATSHLDLIRNNNGNNRNTSNSSFMGFPVHNQVPASEGFSMQDHYKPSNSNTTLLGFSLDHDHNNGFHGGFQGGEGGDDVNGRNLFPFEDLKLPVSSSSATINVDVNDHQKRASGGDAAATSSGYWTRMLSGGSWC